jgi:uncharacterized protein (DUF433 family)
VNWQDHIEQRPDVMQGKPVLKGTRLTVELILQRLSDGATEQDLLASYPKLTADHIRAAMGYAAAAISTDETVFLAPHP